MPRRFVLPARIRPDDAQRRLARRALPHRSGRRWLHNGIAVLAVSVLGIGTASSVVLTGNAERPLTGVTQPAVTTPAVEISRAPGVAQPKSFSRKTAARSSDDRASRDGGRPALSARTTTAALQARTLQTRTKALQAQARAATKRAARLAKKQAAERVAERARKKALLGDGSPVLPVSGGRTAAGFGATGAWARYHTGIDYSAGNGTPVRAPRAGVVTTAGGGGKAGGWAGIYITIRHSDGTSSLYAHLSSADVSNGQQVNAGDVIGQVGQTGRAFGPHLHFEIYPAGVEPGDVYQAVDPNPWLDELGL